jgi:hypothetical protein
MESRIEKRVQERVQEEITMLLDTLEASLPADEFRRVLEIASRMDEQGGDES